MLEATLSALPPLPYKLSSECPAPWPATMTFPVASSYPFLTASSDDSPHDFVVRCYLETLWLPEAICSLRHLVPSLRRVAPDSPTSPHPLPPLITPLLLTARDITVKYRVDLPSIIEAGEGDGQLDDAIMSFSWAHESRDDNRDGGDDDKWTKRWLQRLERRETLIQVLLHFLALSFPLDGLRTNLKRKRYKRKEKPSKAVEPPPTTSSLEDALDILTDRLSIWREGEEAISTNDSRELKSNADSRDWFQTFCEDVAQPAFSYCLPALCESLRQKAFPASPSSRPSSPSVEFPSVPYARPRSRSRSISIDLASAPGPRHSLLRTQSRQNGSKNNTNGRREVAMRRSASIHHDNRGNGPSKDHEPTEFFHPHGPTKPKAKSKAVSKLMSNEKSSLEVRPVMSRTYSLPARASSSGTAQSKEVSRSFVPETPARAGIAPVRARVRPLSYSATEARGVNGMDDLEGDDDFDLGDVVRSLPPVRGSNMVESVDFLDCFRSGSPVAEGALVPSGAGGTRVLVQETPKKTRKP